MDPGKKNPFSRQIFEKFRFLQAISQKISDFPGKFLKISIFSRQIFEKFRFFQANFQKISIFSGNFFTFRFSRQKLLIYCYFWANYSISLQKSPLSNILPVGYMTRYNNIPRPVHDPCDPRNPLPKIWGSQLPNPTGLTPLSVGKINCLSSIPCPLN